MGLESKRKRTTWCLLGLLILCQSALAQVIPMSAPKPLPFFSLRDLVAMGSFEVTVTGDEVYSGVTHTPCVIFRYLYSIDGNTSRLGVHRGDFTRGPVRFEFPHGQCSLPPNTIRHHTKPTFTGVFSEANIASAPELVREEILQRGRPSYVEEICLVKGKTYYAKVMPMVPLAEVSQAREGNATLNDAEIHLHLFETAQELDSFGK